MGRTAVRTLLVAAALGALLAAQGGARHATNLAAIRAYPNYFHLRPIVVAGTLRPLNGNLYLESAGLSMPVLGQDLRVPDGEVEVRGDFWDIGRMRPDDPRLARIDALGRLRVDPDGAWPRPGEVVAIVAGAVTPRQRPGGPTIRGIVLDPERYLDQTVTVTGAFSGRNLLGDLPDAPGRSRWDFVVRSADAALWVSGAEPKGKGFNLSLDQRRDTERWLRVTGTVRRAGGLQWIESKSDQLALATEPEAPDDETEVGVRVPAAPPPEVIFSAPTAGEIDVAVDTTVRVQFSRDIDPSTIEGHVTVAYRAPRGAGAQAPAPPAFKTTYRPGNRVLEIAFIQPLERFRTLVVTLDGEILGTDGQALQPWSASFELGG